MNKSVINVAQYVRKSTNFFKIAIVILKDTVYNKNTKNKHF